MGIDPLVHKILKLTDKRHKLPPDDIDELFRILGQETKAIRDLRIHLLNNASVVTNDSAVKEFLDGFDPSEDFDDPAKVGQEHLYSWFSPANYAASLIKVRVLITRLEIPPDLRSYVEEARQCYALQQYTAVQSLSRTILEVAVNDIGLKLRKFTVEDIDQEQLKMKKRIEHIARDMASDVYSHYKNLCKVVHGRTTRAQDGSLGSLIKTIALVQILYERKAGKIRKTFPH